MCIRDRLPAAPHRTDPALHQEERRELPGPPEGEDITLNTDQLSTGCKTVLNVLYFPDKVFCLKECGNNALEMLYGFEEGYVYSEYAMIPFDMGRVKVQTRECKVIEGYEKLKEWWENEE